MATKQTFKWTEVHNSSTVTQSVLPGFTFNDQGPATIELEPVTGSGSLGIQSGQVAGTTPNGRDPYGDLYDNASEARFGNGRGASSTATIKFKPDNPPADPAKPEVEVTNVDFRVLRIEGSNIAGTGSTTSRVTIRAFDGQGNPVAITATPGSNVTVTLQPDGSVILTPRNGSAANTRNFGDAGTATPNTAQINNANSVSSLIQIAGPVARIEVTSTNTGTNPGGRTFNTLTDINYYSRAVVCFARGTMILTDRGPIAVEDLSVGDLAITSDRGPQAIRWIGSSLIAVDRHANLRPVRIGKGALAPDIPDQDLLVSPQHRVLVRSAIARRMFGTDEVLVAAKQLLQVDGIDIEEDMKQVEYFHILFDQHEVVMSNGAETESLYTGPMALQSVGPAARAEILAIFPELGDRDYAPEPARPLASGRMGRRLAVRHAQNDKQLISGSWRAGCVAGALPVVDNAAARAYNPRDFATPINEASFHDDQGFRPYRP